MSWLEDLSETQRNTFEPWLEHVLHDLVKYLELMPRNLDWDDLEEDDADVLFEAIFETRVTRSETRSARQIWQEALDKLSDEEKTILPITQSVTETLDALENIAAPLLNNEALDALDIPSLQKHLFSVGEQVRALR